MNLELFLSRVRSSKELGSTYFPVSCESRTTNREVPSLVSMPQGREVSISTSPDATAAAEPCTTSHAITPARGNEDAGVRFSVLTTGTFSTKVQAQPRASCSTISTQPGKLAST